MSQCHDPIEMIDIPAGHPAPDVVGTQCHDWHDRHDQPGLTVLIADSNPAIRASIRHVLESDDRFGAIWEVAGGDEAVAQAPGVDLVLLDLRACQGLGALGAIGQMARPQPHAPIVALGRQGEEWLEMAARHEGAVDIIEWPDDEADLRNRLVRAAATPG
jgi:CheY-like chemotaxis protein